MPAARTLLPLLLLLGVPCVRGDALVIGPDWSAVSERLEHAFTNTPEVLIWPPLPAEADASTLQVVPVSSPVSLLNWRARTGAVEAVLATDLPRLREFHRIYALTGLAWKASYQLVVRGDLDREEAPVSVDVDGRLTVRNDTGGSWSNMLLTVVGPMSRPVPVVRESGFLDISPDSALSELWLPPPPRPEPLFNYRIDRRITIRAHEERSFTFVHTERRPGERRYRMTSAEVPLDAPPPGRPLQRYLSVRNEVEAGKGQDLPPGTAETFLGTVRSTMGDTAWLERTPVGGELQIEYGPAEGVLGRRRSLGRKPGTPGQVEESFELQIINDQQRVARVTVEEQPQANANWALVRSTPACILRNRRLSFAFEVAPRTSQFIRYTIRYPFSPL